MFLRMMYDESLAQAAYLIGCQRTGEAIVIDPERDVDRYLDLAKANGLSIVAVAETHIHADFLSGARELAERGAQVFVSDEGDPAWKYEWLHKKSGGGSYRHRLLKDGDTFLVGQIELRAVHTPGHTPEHLCYMVTDRGGGADQPIGVVTGDFVFVGDVGRPDLLETAAGVAGQADVSARRLYRAVRTFMEWPDYLQVWPAHGAGSACGKALGAVPQSTVGYEKRFNSSILAAASEQGFVDSILAGQPEPPLYFARMKRDNKAGPKVLGERLAPRQLGPTELAGVDAHRTAIVDTRPWAAFRAGHMPGALSLPMSKTFSTDSGSIIGEGEPLCLIVEPARLDEAQRGLIRVGLDNFVGWFDANAMEEYRAAGGVLVAAAEVSIGEVRCALDTQGPFALDVRRRLEFAGGHVPGAVNIVHTRLLSRLSELPKDRPILVNCRTGVRSARACSLLERHGFQAVNVAGGIVAWEQAGAPIAR